MFKITIYKDDGSIDDLTMSTYGLIDNMKISSVDDFLASKIKNAPAGDNNKQAKSSDSSVTVNAVVDTQGNNLVVEIQKPKDSTGVAKLDIGLSGDSFTWKGLISNFNGSKYTAVWTYNSSKRKSWRYIEVTCPAGREVCLL